MFNSELLIQYENDGCFDNYSTINLLNRYNKSKDKIQGHIVEFPLLFLKDETFWTYISLSNTIIEIFI